MPTQERDYHVERARTELDRAYRSDNFAAARAHFGLAALHMKFMREASGPQAERRSESLADKLGAALP